MPEEPKKNKSSKQDDDIHVNVETLHTEISEPTAMTPDHEPRDWMQDRPAPPRKKGPIVALIVAVLVVLTGIGGWLGYTLWYQSPDKVVLDALINAGIAKTVSTNGTWSNTADGTTSKLKFDVQSGWKEGLKTTASFTSTGKDDENTSFDLSAIHIPNSKDYVKLNNVKALVDSYFYETTTKSGDASQAYTNAAQEFYKSLIQPAVDKVDGKWVIVTPNDVKKISGPLGEDYQCFEKTMDNLASDSSKLVEIGTMYWKNNFINVKQNLGEKSGNFGYVVGINATKMKMFLEELKDSKFYQDLKNCSTSFSLNTDMGMFLQNASTRIEVWIDKFSHELRSVHVNDKGTMTMDMKFTFNKPVVMTKPTNAVVLESVFSDFTQKFMSNYGANF